MGYTEAMKTLERLPKPVNVARVPHRSPFRYPGGKTWLVPDVRAWLHSRASRPDTFCEPFAGGGIVGLTVAFERLAERVVMVELDEQVAAVWLTILEEGGAQWLAGRITRYQPTAESVRELLSQPASDTRERAFQTIVKNRTFHGGILANGSSLTKNGENGKGIRSRWYPETLARRILAIGKIRQRIAFRHGDGMEHIQAGLDDEGSVWFLDPPYTASAKGAGSRLYTHSELDHERLFGLASRLRGDFMLTYDNAPRVREMAADHGFDLALVAMRNTHNATMAELVIGRDLDWLREKRVVAPTLPL